MSSNPQNPSPNPEPQIPLNTEILEQLHKYVDIAAQSVAIAETRGIGRPGIEKADMALNIANTAAETAGLIIPGVGPAVAGAEALEPIMVPLFTSIVNLFKRRGGKPALPQTPIPVSVAVNPNAAQ